MGRGNAYGPRISAFCVHSQMDPKAQAIDGRNTPSGSCAVSLEPSCHRLYGRGERDDPAGPSVHRLFGLRPDGRATHIGGLIVGLLFHDMAVCGQQPQGQTIASLRLKQTLSGTTFGTAESQPLELNNLCAVFLGSIRVWNAHATSSAQSSLPP